MEKSSALLAIHNDQWRGALMFNLICAWPKGWAYIRDAGCLRRRCYAQVTTHAHIVPMQSIVLRQKGKFNEYTSMTLEIKEKITI